MANKIKDTDYLAISARVRAMETTLLTAERMERLLEARSDEEVSKLLQDCGYPSWTPPGRRLWMRRCLRPGRSCSLTLATARQTPDISTYSS